MPLVHLQDHTLKVWDLKTGQCVMTLQGHSIVRSVAVLPNGNAISASVDKSLKVWDLKTGQCVMTLQGHSDSVISVAVLPDGKAISVSADNLKVWDLKSGQCAMTLQGHTQSVMSVAVLPDGNVISASFDNTLKVWSFGKMSLEFEPWRYLTKFEIEGLTVRWKSPPHLG